MVRLSKVVGLFLFLGITILRFVLRRHLAGVECIEYLLPGLCRLQILAYVKRDRLQVDLPFLDDGVVTLETVGFE